MQAASMLGNVNSTAAQVDNLMKQMRSLLDATMDPDRMALRHLGVDRMGWARLVYCDEAFKVWSGLLKREPSRFQTLHHLAIMYHARAMDREAGAEPAQSNNDWEKALECWGALCNNDAFWNYLADIACKKARRDFVDELRHKMPELLLQVHYDIALAAGTKRYRIEFHIGLVKKSNFSPGAKAAVQRDSYSRFIARVPDTVWQIDTLDPAVIKLGMDAIKEFLSIDPGCVPALEDAVRLQVRLLRERHTELQAAGDDQTVRNRMLNLIKQDADQWGPYFAQLLPVAASMDDEVRQKLALWYRITGDVHRALDRDEESIGFYQSGARIAPADDDEHSRCMRKRGEAMAYVAREKTHNGEAGCREYCDRVRVETGLSVTAHMMLANAYTLLDEFDIAETLCRAGIAIEPDLTDLDAMEEHEKHRENLGQMLKEVGKARRRNEAHKFIEEGKNHLQGDRFQEAVAAFTKARALVPEEPAVPFFRAQAYLGLGETAKALGDARDFSRMLPKDAPQEMREAAEKLTGEIKEREEGIRKFGLQVPILRRDAAKAYKAEQYASAESKLREAISICPAGGKHELECELSIVLANWAVDDVNKAVSSGSSSALDTAERRLKEAARLDASNQHAKANLAALKGMGSSLLRRDAAKAYKADQYALAESKLREAISICPAGDKHELECELSIVLANWAVHDVNQAGPWASSSMLSTADRRLQEALRLDPSNQHARTNLDIVKGMRS